MMCMFCGNRVKCWDKTTDEELALEFVKCGYDDYVLDDTLNWRICLANLSARQTNAELWNREGMLDNLQKQDNVNKINQKTQAGEGRLAFFLTSIYKYLQFFSY